MTAPAKASVKENGAPKPPETNVAADQLAGDRVYRAVEELNEAVSQARRRGLRVDQDVIDLSKQIPNCSVVEVQVYRRIEPPAVVRGRSS